MESLALTTCSLSTSMASPRWSSARLTFRASARDQREVPSRAQGTSCVAASALHQQYATAPLPPLFKGPAARQSQASTANASEAHAACWSVQSSLCSLIHTRCSVLSLEAFIRDPVAWLMNLVYRLQSTLSRVFTGSAQPARSSTGFYASAAASSSQAKSTAVAAATYEPATRRCSSGHYLPSASSRQASDAAQTPTRLAGTHQVSPAPAGQRMPFPIAALAVAAAGALAFSGVWLFRRWRAMVEVERELAQRAAVKKDSLARQKQRFQRALVVDSVNLELPPIKDMDVQPGPVRVEKIISQTSSQQERDIAATSAPQRGGAMPGLAGESLRQWQQFMAASRAKEVTNVSGSQRDRPGQSAAEQPVDRPYPMALDDRMLADLSERIRRANDLTAAGESPTPMPVITFEQLYANNQESDDEAMARRAAERKARWQKQHPEASAGAVAPPRSTATARPSPVAPKKKPATVSASKTATAPANKTTTAPVSKPRSKAPISDNPFAVGIITTSTAAVASSSGLPVKLLYTSRSNGARGGLQPHESSTSRASPPRLEAATTASSPAGGASSRNPFLEAPVTASSTTIHTDTPQPRGRDGSADSQPAHRTSWRTSGEHDAMGAERRVEVASAALPLGAALASTPAPMGPLLTSPSVLPEEESPSPSTPKEEQLVSTTTALGPAPSCSAVTNLNGRALESTSQLSGSTANAAGSCREDTLPSTSGGQEADGQSPRREHDELIASPGRVKRQLAIGQLRTPETQAPSLKRLMRRPSGGPPALDEAKLIQGAAPELQLSESAP